MAAACLEKPLPVCYHYKKSIVFIYKEVPAVDHYTFDTSQRTHPIELCAPYFNAINPTTVVFEQEKISVYVDSLGHIEFFDSANQSLGFVDLPAADSPDLYAHSGQYGRVWCFVEDGKICVKLPVYNWIDHYPDCDGEYDRWSRREVEYFRVVLDPVVHTIAVLDR